MFTGQEAFSSQTRLPVPGWKPGQVAVPGTCQAPGLATRRHHLPFRYEIQNGRLHDRGIYRARARQRGTDVGAIDRSSKEFKLLLLVVCDFFHKLPCSIGLCLTGCASGSGEAGPYPEMTTQLADLPCSSTLPQPPSTTWLAPAS